jgi:dihydropteroate synthase
MPADHQHVLPHPQRCVVMGVLNVTPDSFSDGGLYADERAAIEHGLHLAVQGADYVDVGGESTRPGAERVDPETEIARVLPVVRALAAEGVTVSIDTTRADVASVALDAGAFLINDVSGGLADPKMAGLVAERGCPWVLMHWRGHSQDMAALATYDDVVADVCVELAARVNAAVDAGVDTAQLVLDPGLGFAKVPEHDWALLAQLDAILALDLPVLIGASRKSFLGRLLAAQDGTPRPVTERDAATIATSLLAAEAGVWGVRVHDVQGTSDALRVQEEIGWNRHRLGRNRRAGDRRGGHERGAGDRRDAGRQASGQ